MTRVVNNLPASVHDRLRNEAKKSGRPAEWIYGYFADERFLYRLSQSKYRAEFVLKGGLTFVGWGIPLRRHTMDIDVRAYTSNNLEEVVKIIKDVCTQAVEPDGMIYIAESVTAEIITEEAEHPGIRVRLWAQLGETNKIRMQIDMGFSDYIIPPAITISYPAILPELPGPILQGYPKEAVIAEKLQCIIIRGSINSRMKDFYDIWYIIMQFDIEGTILQDAIINTFTSRKTVIPNDVPVGLSDDYANVKKEQWQAFLNTFNPDHPEVHDFIYIIRTLRGFFVPILGAISKGRSFDLHWTAGNQWIGL